MQKHASFSEYRTQFEPLLTTPGDAVFVDPRPVLLPSEEISFLHYHLQFEIGICLSGSGLFLSHGHVESVFPGDILFFPPGVSHYSHSLEASSPCFCRFAYFDAHSLFTALLASPERAEQLLTACPAEFIPNVFRPDKHPAACVLLKMLLDGCFSEHLHRDSLCALRLAEFFLQCHEWFPHSPATSGMVVAPHSEDPIRRTETYLATHYNESLSTSQLAALCNLSESQFRRRFLAVYGLPPMAYLHRLRGKIAAELLLRTQRTVTEIGETVGYHTPSDFYRHFTAFSGLSPSHFRETGRNSSPISCQAETPVL